MNDRDAELIISSLRGYSNGKRPTKRISDSVGFQHNFA